MEMIYIVDNILNYFIYLFLCHFGFRLAPRKHKIFIAASVFTVLFFGAYNAYFDINSPLVYVIWSVLSISFFFEAHPLHLVLLSAGLMYFTGIIDTFTVMLIQVVHIGGGIADTDLAWWMESAYILSFLIYLLIYFRLLKRNEVYLCDVGLKYKLALLIQGDIFQMFYNFVFVSFNENSARYGWDAYILLFVSIIGVIYAIFLTLGLAIKNILSDRQNKELQSFLYMQKQQYDYQLQQSESVRRLKHDMTNHIGALRELLNQKEVDAAKDYIDTIWEIQNDFDLKFHTGDSFLDVIINYYYYLARKEKISFLVSGKLAGKMPLAMVDLTTLMGNALQNAVEAAAKSAIPKIQVGLVEHRREIFLVVRNSVAEKINTRNHLFMTSKTDRENHGFGLKNMVAVVGKYHGEYYMDSTVEHGEAMFTIRISIPKEEGHEDMYCGR